MASQAGADHFFLKPVDGSQLRTLLLQTLEKRALQFEGQWLLTQVESKAAFCGLIGGSEAMRKVYQAVEAVADSNASVVIRGESGVGKELVARAIVETGARREKPYVCLNCSALPETLMESELFGYERGAFTGAETAKPGMIELAHTGTLFLDEITTLDHGLQSKLLRVLQERSVQRLGGRSAKKIDFRLITATNDDLEDMVKKGRFREDLYYRINVVPIAVPPLREREGDVALLVEHFLRLYCTANQKPAKQVQPEVMEILENYSWPGNVRELENVVRRAMLLARPFAVSAAHVQQILTTTQKPVPVNNQSHASYISDLLGRVQRGEEDGAYTKMIADLEPELFSQAIQLAQGNQAKAARWLGVTRLKMREKLIQFGLHTARDSSEPPKET